MGSIAKILTMFPNFFWLLYYDYYIKCFVEFLLRGILVQITYMECHKPQGQNKSHKSWLYDNELKKHQSPFP